MKKIYYFTIVSTLLIVCLQVLYIISNYNLYVERISFQIEQAIPNIIDNEMINRMSLQKNGGVDRQKIAIQYETTDKLGVDSLLNAIELSQSATKFDLSTLQNLDIVNNSGDIVNQVMQDNLLQQGLPMNIEKIDSLFTATKILNKGHTFSLMTNQSEHMERSNSADIDGYSYKTQKYPIGLYKSQILQLHYNVPLSTFLKISIGSVLASLLIVVIVSTTLFALLKSLNRKSQIVSNIQNNINGTIHDLRSPLGSTIMAIELVEKLVSDEVLKGITAQSKATINQLLNSIDSLLSVVKSNEREMPILRELCSTSNIFEATERIISELSLLYSRNQNIVLVNELPLTFEISLDIMALTNVIRNIIENAIKYSDEGVRILITLKSSNGNLFVSIEDNGWGIAPKHQKQLFNSFYQIPNHNSKQKGYGIGLFQVKRIVNAHNGDIYVISKEGEGSTFNFTINKS